MRQMNAAGSCRIWLSSCVCVLVLVMIYSVSVHSRARGTERNRTRGRMDQPSARAGPTGGWRRASQAALRPRSPSGPRVRCRQRQNQVNRRPMALLASALCAGIRGQRAGGFDEQIDWRRTPQHFDAGSTEATAWCRSERRTVEANCLPEIVNVKIYEEVHLIRSLTPTEKARTVRLIL